MWSSFVDYLVDVGYTRECPGGPGAASAAAATAPPPSPSPSSSPPTPSVPTRLPAARRLVAIGDLHGDLAKARRAFALAGLTDPKKGHAWVGGETVAVQVGDQLDRGDQELRILYFLERLQREAAAAGGALHVLNGNHETMNAGGNFRYATAGADDEMRTWAAWRALGARMAAPCCADGNGSGNGGGNSSGSAFGTPGAARLEALAAPMLEPAEPPSSASAPPPPAPSAPSGPGKAPAAALFAAAIAAAPAPAATPDPPPDKTTPFDPQAPAREVLRGPPPHPTHGGPGGRAKQYNELRYAALSPGGPVATRFFAPHPTVLQVGTTLFVHGGVLPAHVEYGLEGINRETEEWLRGDEKAGTGVGGGGGGSNGGAAAAAAGAAPWFFSWRSGGGGNGGGGNSSGSSAAAPAAGSTTARATAPAAPPPPPPPPQTPPPGFLRGGSAVVWARDYSMVDEARCDCDMLEHVLRAAGGIQPPRRMVVGHTIQQGLGVNAACGGRALRVDVGMSRGCGDGVPEVLEILGDGAVVRRLREGAAPEVLLQPRQVEKEEKEEEEVGRRRGAVRAVA